MTDIIITKGEREDLQRLIRQREKVLKSAARQRSAEPLADFENQMGSEFSFDDDAVWARAAKEAGIEVDKVKRIIAKRSAELGIPARFAPTLNLSWSHRGYDNLLDKRRAELRRMAQTKIDAIEQKAITEIELSCLQGQTELALAGLTSEAARGFIEKLPSVETLMPALSFAEIAGEDEDEPIAEQLISPNALRQRRYREREALRRNGQALLAAPSDQDEGEGEDGEAAS